MSDVPRPDAPPGAAGAGGDQPTEEELRAYLGQLREAPADQVLAEVLSGLLNAAQVKLGRRDARLLLDIAAAAVDAGRDRLPSELTQQVDEVLTQLRLAQVEAEREVAQRGGTEASDLAASPGDVAGPDGGDAPAAGPQPGSQDPGSDPASRLWVPGR